MSSSSAHIDQDMLRELRGVLGKDFPVLVRTFLADSESRLARLREAKAVPDAHALREAAHSLKGSSLNIGAGQLAALCLAIEQAARGGDMPRASALIAEVEAEFREVATQLVASLHGG